MSVSDQKELGLAPEISLVPIKKRFQLRSSCSGSKESSLQSNDSGELVKQEPSALFSSGLCMPGNIAVAESEFSSNSRKSAGKGLKLDCNVSETNKSSEQAVGEGNIYRNFASTDNSLSQTVGASWEMAISSAMVEKVKKEKKENFTLDEPRTEGIKYQTGTTYFDEPRKQNCVSNCDNRANWDLNTSMDSWDALRNDPSDEQDRNDRQNKGSIPQNKLHTSLVHPTMPVTSRNSVSDVCLGLSILPGRNLSNITLSNLRVPASDKNSELGLDLQLKPPSLPKLRMDLGDAPPDLSLSLTGNSSKSLRVKQEPREESLTSSKLCKSNSVPSSGVKSEPSDVSHPTKAVKLDACHKTKSITSETVKEEPSHEPSKECRTGVVGKSPLLECQNEKMIPVRVEANSNTDKNYVSSDKNMLPNDSSLPLITKSRDIVETNSTVVANHITSGCSGHSESEKQLPGSTCIGQDVENGKCRSSEVLGCVDSHTQELDSNCAQSSKVNIASNSHLESKMSNVKELTVCGSGRSEGSEDMDCSDCEDTLISKKAIVKDLQMDVHHGSLEGMGSISEKQIDNKELSDVPNSINKSKDRKRNHGSEYNESEDGENKNISVRGTLERSNEKELLLEVKGAEDASIRNLRNSDIVEKKIEVYEETQITKSFDKCNDKNVEPEGSSSSIKDLQERLSGSVLSSYSNGSRTSLQKDDMQTMNLPSEMESTLAIVGVPKGVNESDRGQIVSRQANATELALSSKHGISSNIDTNDSAKKHGYDGFKQGRTNDAGVSNNFQYGRGKPFSAWSGERPTSKYVWHRNLNFEGNRNGRYNARPSKFQNHEKVNMPTVKNGSDFVNSRRDHDKPSYPHYRRNSNQQYASEFNKSKYHRYGRPGRPEIPLDVTHENAGGGGRLVERPLGIETPDISHFSDRRWSTRSGEDPLVLDPRITEATMRDVTPDRFIHGEVHDGPLLFGDEEGMRESPDEYSELPEEYFDFSSHPHHRLQYRRGRRSLSPIPRRGPPMHLPRVHSPHRWSPSGRALDIGFDRPPALIRDRSRHSPQQTSFLSPHDALERGADSPQYNRLPCNMDEIHPGSEFDYRGPPGPIRRFGQENADEYFDNYVSHPPEHAEDFVDRRELDDRRFGRPFQPHPIGDIGEECPPYPVGHGPRRPVRFGRDENFHDEVNLRTDGRIRNRAGNMANRSRAMPEQDYVYHETPGFRREDGYNNGRPKRRRFG